LREAKDMEITDEMQEAYIDRGKCPVCGGGEICLVERLTPCLGQELRDMECDSCHAVWTEKWREVLDLDGIQNLKTAKELGVELGECTE
jgi:hypothetical protein